MWDYQKTALDLLFQNHPHLNRPYYSEKSEHWTLPDGSYSGGELVLLRFGDGMLHETSLDLSDLRLLDNENFQNLLMALKTLYGR
jgi:hypothetical protein